MEKTKYSPADGGEKRTCYRKCTSVFCALGLLTVIVGIVMAVVMGGVIHGKILEKLPIVNGSQAYDGWKDPAVSPEMNMFFFNITNLDAFLRGREKPRLVEVGPYVYRQKLERVNVVFHDNGTMSFQTRRTYFFAPEISAGRDSDKVVVPNVPLFGVMKVMESESQWRKIIFEGMLDSYSGIAVDSVPFMTLAVKEYLWGYDSIILSIKRKMEACDEDPFSNFCEDEITSQNLAKFGLVRSKNATMLPPLSIFTGEGDIKRKGQIDMFNFEKNLTNWREDRCNEVHNKRNPGGFPVGLQKTEQVQVFLPNICRGITFKYVKDVMHQDIKTYRFSPLETTFDSPEDTPENSCYCVKKPCLPSGLFDLGGCKKFSPIYMSWPHFYRADPSLLKNVEGLNPQKESHTFIFDVEPTFGINLAALARLQMNVIVKKNGFKWFQNIHTQTVYPFVWLEEGIRSPPPNIYSKVQLILTLPNNLKNIIGLAILVLGLVFMIPEIIVWIRSSSCGKK